MSHEFQTSLTSTAIRLVELSPKPVMLVCSEKGQRKWSIRSPEVSKALRVKKTIDTRTLAHALLSDPNAAKGPFEVQARRWFDGSAASAEVVLEDSINLRPDLVLSLISWEQDFHAGSHCVH